MNKILPVIGLILAFSFQNSVAQDNMGVGTNVPDPSSVLDLTSSNQGFLVPRMNTAQRTGINSPATGSGASIDNRPVYYALAFIMKL